MALGPGSTTTWQDPRELLAVIDAGPLGPPRPARPGPPGHPCQPSDCTRPAPGSCKASVPRPRACCSSSRIQQGRPPGLAFRSPCARPLPRRGLGCGIWLPTHLASPSLSPITKAKRLRKLQIRSEAEALGAGRNLTIRGSHSLMIHVRKPRPEPGDCRARTGTEILAVEEDTNSVVSRRVGASQAGLKSHLRCLLTLQLRASRFTSLCAGLPTHTACIVQHPLPRGANRIMESICA